MLFPIFNIISNIKKIFKPLNLCLKSDPEINHRLLYDGLILSIFQIVSDHGFVLN